MHVLGQRFGQSVGQCLQHDGTVIVMRLLETLHVLFNTNTRRYRKRTDVVGMA
jgi:hypothetical protein